MTTTRSCRGDVRILCIRPNGSLMSTSAGPRSYTPRLAQRIDASDHRDCPGAIDGTVRTGTGWSPVTRAGTDRRTVMMGDLRRSVLRMTTETVPRDPADTRRGDASICTSREGERLHTHRVE